MRKRVIQKGNLHPADYNRCLITDTQPADVPIIVSNDGFYRNVKRNLDLTEWKSTVDGIIRSKAKYTKPYRYSISKSLDSRRRLSLVHPSSQLDTAAIYEEYGNLICYNCRKSVASLRAPERPGSSFFIREHSIERDFSRGMPVDTVDLDHTRSNPASYFAYRGIDRLHKFFSSTSFLRLEKRFSVMRHVDISKCFSSIYTHSLFWAVSDIDTAKQNTMSESFANKFDKHMSSMNYSETNGICVGSETSRIFAEIILCEIDRRVIIVLEKAANPILFGKDYEFYRYVDDYYVFADSDIEANLIVNAISRSLSDFNLHLSSEKGELRNRPFLTDKGRLVRETDIALSDFFDRFLDTKKTDAGPLIVPKRIWNPRGLLRSFLESVKALCYDLEAGYDGVANYVIGALCARISRLTGDASKYSLEEPIEVEYYISSLMMLMEAVYFFFTVHPSPPSSLRLAESAVRCINFFSKYAPDRSLYLEENLVRWTFQVLRSMGIDSTDAGVSHVKLEAMNALLVLGQISQKEALAEALIRQTSGNFGRLNYFDIVCFLFCMGPDPGFEEHKSQIVARVKDIILGSKGVSGDSEAAHLALDIIACPYLNVSDRIEILRIVRDQLQLPKSTPSKLSNAVAEFEAVPWFVNWDKIDLLALIRKKELSSVY